MTEIKKKNFKVQIAFEECKGCGRCIHACPVHVLQKTTKVNSMGCVVVEYIGNCIGCGSCFYSCPEPGAITVIEIQDTTGDETE